jgi:hypothetical protein
VEREEKTKTKKSKLVFTISFPSLLKKINTMELDSFLLALDAVEGDPPGLHRDCKRCK